MIGLTLIVCWFLCSALCLETSKRIVGGYVPRIEDVPYSASIQLRRGPVHVCGGSIITRRHVLTAAHCLSQRVRGRLVVWRPRAFLVRAGSLDNRSGRCQIAWPIRFLVHPEFRSTPKVGVYHDLGVVLLEGSGFAMTESVRPIPLPVANDTVPSPEEHLRDMEARGVTCITWGWGRTSAPPPSPPYHWRSPITGSSRLLRAVSLPLATTAQCTTAFKLLPGGGSFVVSEKSHVCTLVEEGGRDACVGDSGGGLVCQGVLWAVTSWGMGCAAPRAPAVFARVDPYIDWIGRALRESSATALRPDVVTYATIILIASKYTAS